MASESAPDLDTGAAQGADRAVPPAAAEGGIATPATNKEIAEELFLSVEAVKAHLRGLFERFEVGDVPQNQKRVALAERAFRTGSVTPRDLAGDSSRAARPTMRTA